MKWVGVYAHLNFFRIKCPIPQNAAAGRDYVLLLRHTEIRLSAPLIIPAPVVVFYLTFRNYYVYLGMQSLFWRGVTRFVFCFLYFGCLGLVYLSHYLSLKPLKEIRPYTVSV